MSESYNQIPSDNVAFQNEPGNQALMGLVQAAAENIKVAPAPPTDPIAIAALVAELPELEAAYKVAKEASDKALAKLNDMQLRIDRTISALKDHAPAGSRWSSADSSKFMEERAAYLAREIANYAPKGVNGMPSGTPKKY